MAEIENYEVTVADCLWAIDGAVLVCREERKMAAGDRGDDLDAYVKALSAIREQLLSENFRLVCARRSNPIPVPLIPDLPDFLRPRRES